MAASKSTNGARELNLASCSDDRLILLAKGGDGAAFGRLLERHYDFVYRVAYRWCGRRADAEDVAQEVCIRVGKAIATYRGAGAFTTWLYALTLNAVRDLRRKSQRDEAKSEAFRVHALSSAAVAEAPDQTEPADELWLAVRRLPDKQRDAVLLVYGKVSRTPELRRCWRSRKQLSRGISTRRRSGCGC